MNELISLMSGLTARECKNIARGLSRYSSRGHSQTHHLKLFKLLRKHSTKHKDSTFYSSKLLGSSHDARFPMIKNRFKTKLIDTIATEINVIHNTALDYYDKSLFTAQNNLVTAQYLLRSSGNTQSFLNLVVDAEKIARKYQLYSVLLECLRLKKYYKGFAKGKKEFDLINKEIEFVEFCNQATNKANDYYYRLILRTDFTSSYRKSYLLRSLTDSIYELQEDFAYTKSYAIKYYLKSLEMEYYHLRKEYHTAKQTCKELYDLIKTNEIVYRKQRLGHPLINWAYFDILLGNYDQAIKYAKLAIDHVIKPSNNYFVWNEYLFYAQFYNKSYDEALAVINEMIRHTDSSHGSFRISKYNYLRACLYVRMNMYKEALIELGAQSAISKDRSGWDLGIRFLRIMTLIDYAKLDEAQAQVTDLTKQFYRLRGNIHIDRRSVQIIKLFIELSNNGFIFKTQTKRIVNLLRRLGSTNTLYSWSPFNSELIPIHFWFSNKTRQQFPSKVYN